MVKVEVLLQPRWYEAGKVSRGLKDFTLERCLLIDGLNNDIRLSNSVEILLEERNGGYSRQLALGDHAEIHETRQIGVDVSKGGLQTRFRPSMKANFVPHRANSCAIPCPITPAPTGYVPRAQSSCSSSLEPFQTSFSDGIPYTVNGEPEPVTHDDSSKPDTAPSTRYPPAYPGVRWDGPSPIIHEISDLDCEIHAPSWEYRHRLDK